MDCLKYKRNVLSQDLDDPEFEAEVIYAKKNGFSLPKLPSDSVQKITEAFLKGSGKNFKSYFLNLTEYI